MVLIAMLILRILSLCFQHLFLLSVHLGWMKFASVFYYLAYFCYYLWTLLHFLELFMSLTVLFQLTFTFIYSTFSKKFSVLLK